MSSDGNIAIVDSELCAHSVTRNRKYAVFTSTGCTDLDSAMHYARMALQEAYGFDEDATQLEVKDCIVVALFKGFVEYVMICYQDEQVSVALIDLELAPCMFYIVQLLNTATLSLWEPLELTTNLVAAFLAAYLDGSLQAQIKFQVESNAEYRAKLEIQNHFVDNALVELSRDDHLIEGIGRIEQSVLKHLAKLNWRVGRLKSLKVDKKLRISARGHLVANADVDLVDLTKFISHALQVPMKVSSEKEMHS